ncbi:MAG: hypothetical protein CMC76_09670 [Flavobacteriaceae bacterium]|nr:hypothetical protein [Flavobacteriaceae bacterium]|tara:strand:+ start:721 stop:1854 length:1134 start_codon:yes stop_codon:yes gene_type:complete
MGLKSKNISVLISDGEHPLLTQVVYCLSKSSNIRVYVVSKNDKVPMKHSRYIHKFFHVPEFENSEKWFNHLDGIIEKNDIDIVMPISEDGILFLLDHKNSWDNFNKTTILTSSEYYKKGINKAELAQHMKTFDIPCPSTYILKNGTIVDGDVKSLSFPCIVKPASGISGEGIHIFKEPSELKDFVLTTSKTYVIQEFINGYDIDCSVLCKDGQIIANTIQKGSEYENRRFAPPIGIGFLYNEDLLDVVKKLMRSLQWSGLAHIDLRFDSDTNTFKVIEINGRFWGSVDASMLVGVNFADLYIRVSLGESVEQINYKTKTYLSLKGLVKHIKRAPLKVFNFSFLKNQTPLFFSIKDPLPVILRFINRTRVILAQRFSS